MKKKPIAIVASHAVSALGDEPNAVWNAYLNNKSYLRLVDFGKFKNHAGTLPVSLKAKIEDIRKENKKYAPLDSSVLGAMYCAREVIKKTGWASQDFGINLGSSRGATELFEKYHQAFLAHPQGKTATLSSPTTTLGNIATWVAQDLRSTGLAIEHSITCSTALHALINGVAWLRSGMSNRFLVGGSEFSNTPFTVAQMKALKVYAKNDASDYPCRALDLKKQENTLCIGEGASIFALTTESVTAAYYILGIGYATELLTHGSAISEEAICFQKSMKMALKDAKLNTVDAVVMHATGTVKGDVAEYKAMQKVFQKLPLMTCNKWKIGHTLGTSGGHSLFFALQMLKHQYFVPPPYAAEAHPQKLDKIMVNAVGFGGNAVSIIIGRRVA